MKTVLGILMLSALSVACTNTSTHSSTDSKPAAQRFETSTVGSDELLKDNKSGLTWTNSSQGCRPLFDMTPAETAAAAKSFCGTMNFGGHNDWRLPTVEEMTELEVQTDAADFKLYYKNPSCKRVLALAGHNDLTSITTSNMAPVGRNVGHALPAGTRCVRQ